MKRKDVENIIVNGYLVVYIVLAVTGIFIPLIKYFIK
jgi:hypothetical protein